MPIFVTVDNSYSYMHDEWCAISFYIFSNKWNNQGSLGSVILSSTVDSMRGGFHTPPAFHERTVGGC